MTMMYGNSLKFLMDIMINHNSPHLIVAHTIKGRGVSFMENQPKWHSNWLGGEMLEKARQGVDMRRAFGETLMKLADKDERIVLLTGDVEQEMEPFKEKYPHRFFNLGLTEQSITSMAAGLSHRRYETHRILYHSLCDRTSLRTGQD